jgi:hypothetical protein
MNQLLFFLQVISSHDSAEARGMRKHYRFYLHPRRAWLSKQRAAGMGTGKGMATNYHKNRELQEQCPPGIPMLLIPHGLIGISTFCQGKKKN